MTAKVWVQYPASWADATYLRDAKWSVRYGPVLGELRANTLLQSVTHVVYGPDNVELARSSPMSGAQPWDWTWPAAAPVAKGHKVWGALTDPVGIPVGHATFFYSADRTSLQGPQKIPVGYRNNLDEFGREGGTRLWGWKWVQYPGTPPVFPGRPLVPRAPMPIPLGTPRSQKWQQALTSTGTADGFSSRYFSQIRVGPGLPLQSGGNQVTVLETQMYDHADAWSLNNGTCVDGPHTVGKVAAASTAFYEASGDRIINCPVGRTVRLDRYGRIETLHGWRLKPNTLPPITPTDVDPDDAWQQTFYDYVGTITDGPATTNNSWQRCCDPRDEAVHYIADTDNHRIVIYDTRTKVGRTFAGGLGGKTDFAHVDGQGLVARFNAPRGICFDLTGEFMYVCDDHNSAIRKLDRLGNVTTMVKSARGDNYDLVQAQPGFATYDAYIAHLRSFMSAGAFGVANFMHPQSACMDSQGNLITAGHHPAQLYRFNFTARTVEILANLPGSFDINYLAKSWFCVSVDRWGEFGEGVDAIGVSYWMQGSALTYSKNGTLLGTITGTGVDASGVLEQGPADQCIGTPYPAMVCYGPGGRRMHHGWAGEGIYEQTMRRIGDPVIDMAKWLRGIAEYKATAMPVRGHRGHSRLVDCSADVVSDDVAYYLAWEANGEGTVSGPADPPPPPPPPPVPLPTIANLTATPSTLPFGGGTVQLSATVTDAAVLKVDGFVVDALPASVLVTASRLVSLTAENVTGAATKYAQVTVAAAPPPPPPPPPPPGPTDSELLAAARAKLAQVHALAVQIVALSEP